MAMDKSERVQQRTAEWWCRLTLRGLAASFAVVGAIFFFFPDGTVRVMNAVGGWLGDFSPAPASALRFWLSLAIGYMVLVTALAYLAQRDLWRHRDLLLLLALGKATSSLTCLAFYRYSLDAFLYLANFLVDGSIALAAVVIWFVVPSLERPAGNPAASGTGRGERAAHPAFPALLEAMVPAGGPFQEGARESVRAADIDAFMGGGGTSRTWRRGLWLLEFSPFFLPPLRGRRFSRLSLEDRVRMLEAWERSPLVPLRQLLHTLKMLVMIQFYSQPQIQARLGYPDPLVRVPRTEGAS
jgi:hypothetical protein